MCGGTLGGEGGPSDLRAAVREDIFVAVRDALAILLLRAAAAAEAAKPPLCGGKVLPVKYVTSFDLRPRIRLGPVWF
jgi:hypothetical protein